MYQLSNKHAQTFLIWDNPGRLGVGVRTNQKMPTFQRTEMGMKRAGWRVAFMLHGMLTRHTCLYLPSNSFIFKGMHWIHRGRAVIRWIYLYEAARDEQNETQLCFGHFFFTGLCLCLHSFFVVIDCLAFFWDVLDLAFATSSSDIATVFFYSIFLLFFCEQDFHLYFVKYFVNNNFHCIATIKIKIKINCQIY